MALTNLGILSGALDEGYYSTKERFWISNKQHFLKKSDNVIEEGWQIDLFTDRAAILNLLDLRSIMGCPGSARSVFTRAFRAKRELHCIFLEKKAIIITSKHGTTIFFPITIFF